MMTLPEAPSGVPVLRVDLSDEALWKRVRAEMSAADHEGSGATPELVFADRRDLTALDVEALEAATPRQYPSAYESPFVIVFDTVAASSPGHPLLLIDLAEEETSESFRALPREIATIEANLSISNMDFDEFGDAVDDDGVFRGFES